MTELLVIALGLGVAGLDPAGALIAVGVLGAGARERNVMLFGLVSVVGTAVLGTVLSVTVGQRLQTVQWRSLLPPDRLAALIELLIAVGLIWWAVVRLRRPAARPPKPARTARSGAAALLGLGVVWAGAAVLDPTFVGLTVVAGREESVIAVALAHVIWIVVSQAPLVLLMGGIATGRHERAVAGFNRLWNRARPVAAWVGTGALMLAGAGFALDSLWWFATEPPSDSSCRARPAEPIQPRSRRPAVTARPGDSGRRAFVVFVTAGDDRDVIAPRGSSGRVRGERRGHLVVVASSARSPRTRWSMSSRMGLTCSGERPAGSSSRQSR